MSHIESENTRQLLRVLSDLLASPLLAVNSDLPAVAEQVDELLPKVEAYLNDFELWRAKIEQENPLADASPGTPELKHELRQLIEELYERHQDLAGRLTLLKRDTARQLGGIHQRGRALKAYIDRYPSRISIAGKRKG